MGYYCSRDETNRKHLSAHSPFTPPVQTIQIHTIYYVNLHLLQEILSTYLEIVTRLISLVHFLLKQIDSIVWDMETATAAL